MGFASKGCGFDASFDVALTSIAGSCATREDDCAIFEIGDVVVTPVTDADEFVSVLNALAMPFTVDSICHRVRSQEMEADTTDLKMRSSNPCIDALFSKRLRVTRKLLNNSEALSITGFCGV